MYQVKQEDLIGELEGFPIVIVQEMVKNQVEQGNKADVTVFQIECEAGIDSGGFSWVYTEQGIDFWSNIILRKQFDKFDTKETRQTNFALQQFIGYVAGATGETSDTLIESMGLTENEWKVIRDEIIFNKLSLREEIDNYFNI